MTGRRLASYMTGEVAAEATLRIMPASMFYQKLANEGHEPEYFGAHVEPGDANAVLLRWKLNDRETRVIYADLRVETVSDGRTGLP